MCLTAAAQSAVSATWLAASTAQPRAGVYGHSRYSQELHRPALPVTAEWDGLVPPEAARVAIGDEYSNQDLLWWPAGTTVPAKERERYWSAVVLEGTLRVCFDDCVAWHELGPHHYLLVHGQTRFELECSGTAGCLFYSFQFGPGNPAVPRPLPGAPGDPDLPPKMVALTAVSWGQPNKAGLRPGKLRDANQPLLLNSEGVLLYHWKGGSTSPERPWQEGGWGSGLLLSGELAVTPPDRAPLTLRAPAYFEVPRGAAAGWACKNGGDCVVLAR